MGLSLRGRQLYPPIYKDNDSDWSDCEEGYDPGPKHEGPIPGCTMFKRVQRPKEPINCKPHVLFRSH